MRIGVRLAGGIGNMMFQIAFGEYMSYKHGITVEYTNARKNFISEVEKRSNTGESLSFLEKLLSLKCAPDGFKNRIMLPFHYVDIKPENNIEYIGYFQSEKYFDCRADFVRGLFNGIHSYNSIFWGDETMKIINGNSCAVHIRRGDYLKLPHHHPVLSPQWYKRATAKMPYVDTFVVFSDDHSINFDDYITGSYVVSDLSPLAEMSMMSRCSANIIANSSFSWWGAYLNMRQPHVIAPDVWFGSAYGHNTKDLIPEDWHIEK